jgi:hypothetical protein
VQSGSTTRKGRPRRQGRRYRSGRRRSIAPQSTRHHARHRPTSRRGAASLFGQLEYSSKVQQRPRYSTLFSAARLMSASLSEAQRRQFR